MRMVSYEIIKKHDDGHTSSYFTGTNFEVMAELWNKYKWETGCEFVIKIPNELDNREK